MGLLPDLSRISIIKDEWPIQFYVSNNEDFILYSTDGNNKKSVYRYNTLLKKIELNWIYNNTQGYMFLTSSYRRGQDLLLLRY